mmetsp:Transcript_10251/g.12438  ORF Transcript_10251/g.12438 Transcript_10251/m.12438 type:complete len:153 (-) Transcript_10251:233-691(-)|eukprot:CAMPEP_0114359700 /NCGR_PEP_ID=MMETSP0101-20121206/23218_1 /TAXON_ID=38822 ORGANISM="Pteridomonas danica, Strain PT" /NCGR_SAMPLE_ID=MMETSP0101 /ASSEMBLY_ACC=CAM_ASM_000211 /LENGTH=152 /DNA_ID=CAMNT_0001503383 /DNA_START=40 /DNA_END=498 /DNA_ORIENTATION=-
MSFLWGSGTPASESTSEVSMQTKEFDDLLASKDAELEAILGGLDTPEPSAPSTSVVVSTKVAEKIIVPSSTLSEKSRGVSSRPTHQPNQTKTSDNKISSNDNTVLGVPRKYVLFVFMTLFMGAFLFQFMGSLWGDSDLDETFAEKPAAGSAP